MENRFGFKDFVLVVLFMVLIISVWLSMKQADRQGDELKAISTQLSGQTRELSQIRRKLEEGISVDPSHRSSTPHGAGPDPFNRVHRAKQNEDYALGDWLVQAFGVNPPKLTPLLSSDVYASILQARVIETLTTQDPYTLEYKPLLCTDWTIEDNAEAYDAFVEEMKANGATDEEISVHPDRPWAVTITFRLRRGITFSDGESFDADDIVFSYDWIMNPKVDAPRARAYFKRIKRVEKVGTHAVVVKFEEPYFEAFELAGSIPVLSETFYGAHTPEDFNKNPGLLLGSGPYRLKDPSSWRPGDPLELIRNERYWGESGPFKRLVCRVIENEAAELTAFRNGEIDMYGAEPIQYQGIIEDTKLMDRVNNYVLEHMRTGYTYIAWNQKRKGEPTPFADRRVRQAMTMLCDRESVCDQIFLGYAKVATGPFHYLGEQADSRIQPWPHDVDRARSLLAEAGFEDRDGDGVLESPDGTPFQIKLSYPASGETYKRVLLLLKDSFARGGVVLELDPTDWPLMIRKLETRDFDAITLGWSAGIETDIYQMFHSSQIEDNGDNFLSYANRELDQAITEARRTMDRSKRMTLWRRTHQILHEDQPYTFLFRRKGLFFMDKRIHNVEQTKVGFNFVSSWAMPIEWYVPTTLQRYRD